MGNCAFGSFAEVEEAIKVMTPSGGVMEFDGPLTAECITNDYPGHGIFHGCLTSTSQPLPHNEDLLNGELYYLLPLNHSHSHSHSHPEEEAEKGVSLPAPAQLPCASDHLLPRISTHTISTVTKCRKPCIEMIPKQRSGVWRVKLVITPEQLTEILSQESNTEALIESVRTVAKCATTTNACQDHDHGDCNSLKPSVEMLSDVAVDE
ncbi:hypothetical protein SUGI_1159980 [Cryptomeria japonica]|nr:hypothetical protein SUGI_1159980 [Cryptomeria japonica]